MSGQIPFRVRRATVDDLEALVAMWTAMQFDIVGLEKRLTEFQVAEAEEGTVMGAVGVLIVGRDGVIHHEAFADYAYADAIRTVLWERLQKIAENHGLFRIWTCETAPFWDHNGFTSPSAELRGKLPPSLDKSARWLAVQLREEVDAPAEAIEKEFETFLKSERAQTERLVQHAKTMKTIATLLAVLLFITVLVLAFYYFTRSRLAVP